MRHNQVAPHFCFRPAVSGVFGGLASVQVRLVHRTATEAPFRVQVFSKRGENRLLLGDLNKEQVVQR